MTSRLDAKTATVFLAGSVSGALIMHLLSRRRPEREIKRQTSGAPTDSSSEALDAREGRGLRSVQSMMEMSSATWLHKEFHYSINDLIEIAHEIKADLCKGLHALDQSPDVDVPMLPSYVTKLPSGTEKGEFLALDLGGTNFRVVKITLCGDGSTRIKASKEEIPREVYLGDERALFGYVAESLVRFVPESVGAKDPLPLGFTFSFPCEQKSLDSAFLLRWTKGFDVSGVIGSDVVQLLQRELAERNCNISIKAVVNDTVGTLMTRALTDKQCQVGLIIGTGCNAAYVECADNVKKYEHMKPSAGFKKSDRVIVNTEMGNFCGSKLRRTRVDRLLDQQSLHPKTQFWEKMISGFYLGELARLIVVMFADEKKIFNKDGLPDCWRNKNAFSTAIMGQIEADEDSQLRTVETLLQREMSTFGASLNDRTFLKMICRSISKRAARVAAAGVFAVLLQINDHQKHKKVTVAVDGSVFKLYPQFRTRMQDAISDMLTCSELKLVVDLVDAEDGSGVGAAAVAASV